MRICMYRSERVTLNSAAHEEAKAMADWTLDALRRHGRLAVKRWDDDYNDTSATGTVAVYAEI